MRLLIDLFRVLAPVINDTAAEKKGSVAVVLAFIAAIMTFAVTASDVVEDLKPVEEQIELLDESDGPTDVEDLTAPDVQDEDTDAGDLFDIVDPPDAGGDLVVLSPVRVAWDDSYYPPSIHRRDSTLGGWTEYVARQRDYRRRGVR